MKHRPEVDGLRSVAVVPVILFHAEVALFSGGYVGVDVFFVISGYLITGILAVEMAEGRFSLIRFYERRARRILPALFAVMLVCLPFAWMWMLPDEMLNFSRAVVAVSVFASNILFYRQSDYFGPAADEQVLLHTWSLAVEEQFYIFFPLLLLFLWRLGWRPVTSIIGVLAFISLALCHLFVSPAPDATFYLIHTRAWELFAGALVALWQLRGGSRVQGRSGIGAALGLAMIFYGIFMFDSDTPFPSLWALLPVGGTALILLFAAPGTLVAQLLSRKPFVWVGLISYSAYLIHQPLLAFARVRSLTEPEPLVLLGLAALTLPLAWLSWRYVEQPFRRPGSGAVSRRGIFVGSAVGLFLFSGIGMAGHVTRGMSGRVSEAVVAMAAASSDRNPRRNTCLGWQPLDVPDSACATGGNPKVGIMGDSLADGLAWALHSNLAKAGYGVYQATASACWPLPGFRRKSDVRRGCDQHNRSVWKVLATEDYDIVVLSARWTLNLVGTRFDNGEGGVERAAGSLAVESLRWQGAFGAAGDRDRQERVLGTMQSALLDILDRHKVVLVYPVPEAGWNVPKTAAKALVNGSQVDLSTSYDLFRKRNAKKVALFDSIDHPNLYRIRPAATFCNRTQPGRCITVLDGKPLYSDDNHLSRHGAELLSRGVVKLISQIRVSPDA